MKTENFYKRLIKPLLTMNLLFAFCASNAQWVKQITNMPLATLTDIYCIGTDTCYAVGNGGTGIILKTENGGITWNQLSSGNSTGLFGVYFINTNVGFVVGNVILKTVDGGKSWYEPTYPSQGASKIYFFSDSLGFATQGQYIIKTKDKGETWAWTNSYKSLKGNITAIQFFTENIGFCLTQTVSDSRVWKTTNGGDNWTLLYTDTTSQFQEDMLFVGDSTAYIAGDKGIFKSNNAGVTWTDLGLKAYFYSIDCINKDTCYAAGGGIYKTTDGGKVWEKDTLGLSGIYGWRKIHFPTATVGYVVGTGGKIYKLEKNTGIKEPQNKQISISIYPNPLTTHTYIMINNTYAEHSKLFFELYDVVGRKIRIINLNNSITQLQRDGFESGIYIYKITNNTEIIASGKLIIN